MRYLFLSVLFLGMISFTPASIQAQDSVYTFRAMSYNLLAFGLTCDGVSIVNKYRWLESILSTAQPDLLAVQEVAPNLTYPNNIISQSIIYSGKMDYAWYDKPRGDRVNILFYNTELFGLLEVDEIPARSIRTVNRYKLYFKPSVWTGDTTFLTVINTHLKANQSEGSARWQSTIDIMNWIGENAAGENIILMGDLNIYGSNENAYQELAVSSTYTTPFVDPTGLKNGWAGRANARFHTQSPRSSSSDCGASGGMDDRFDFILHSQSAQNGTKGLTYVDSSHQVMGNDGRSYESGLNCGGNTTVPQQVCFNLVFMSDHLPVIADYRAAGAPLNREIAPFTELGLRLGYGHHTWELSWGTSRSTPLTLSIIDLSGRTLLQKTMFANNGAQEVINYDYLPKGLYLLQFQDQAGKLYTQKVLAK